MFRIALERVRQLAGTAVQNGEWTERGLARRLGVSQAHLHNVLKGRRRLTPELADVLMLELRITLEEIASEPPPTHKTQPRVPASR